MKKPDSNPCEPGSHSTLKHGLIALAVAGAAASFPIQALAEPVSTEAPSDSAKTATEQPAATTQKSQPATAQTPAATATSSAAPTATPANSQQTAAAPTQEATTSQASVEDILASAATSETAATSAATDPTPAATTQAQPAAQAGAAQSSDESTYEDAGLYQITINYVDTNGNKVAPSSSQAVKEGQSWSVTSPTIEGYAASQATISGTAEGAEHDQTYTVTYRDAHTSATYTVVTELQAEDGYYIYRSEQRTGTVGQTASVSPASINGYHCVTSGFGLQCNVTADGQAVITLRYDLNIQGHGIFYVTNGSYVPAQTGAVGDAVVAPKDPTRTGYRFVGWDTNGDGVADALPTTIGNADVTATAVWAPAETSYQINYYVRTPDGTVASITSTRKTGITGQQTTFDSSDELDTHASEDSDGVANVGRYAYLQLTGAPTAETIAADGSTVVNVYYEFRNATVNIYEISTATDNYYNDLNGAHLIGSETVSMGYVYNLPSSDDATQHHRDRLGDNGENFTRWIQVWFGRNRDTGQRTLQTLIDDGIYPSVSRVYSVDANGNIIFSMVAEFVANARGESAYIMYTDQNIGAPSDPHQYSDENYTEENGAAGPYQEVLKDDGTGNYQGNTSWRLPYNNGGFRTVAYRFSNGVWDGQNQSDIQWGEWHYLTDNDNDPSNARYWYSSRMNLISSNVIELMRVRQDYTLQYYSQGQLINSAQVAYETAINTATQQLPTAPEGMVFGGWYDNPDFEGNAITTFDMPNGTVMLYARWMHPDVTVTYDSDGGTAVDSETVAWDNTATRPADPTRTGYRFGGWWYYGTNKDGTTATVPARFSFDMPLETNYTVYAAWEQEQTPTTYRVIYRTANGQQIAERSFDGIVGNTVYVTPSQTITDASGVTWRYPNSRGQSLTLSADPHSNVLTFTLTRDASHQYRVRYVDQSNNDLRDALDFSSEDVLRDLMAPTIAGYHVLNGGQGYVMASDNGGVTVLTFVYAPDQQPVTPTTPQQPAQPQAQPQQPQTQQTVAKVAPEQANAEQASAAQVEAQALPKTSDASDAQTVGIIGLLSAALGLFAFGKSRKKGKHEA